MILINFNKKYKNVKKPIKCKKAQNVKEPILTVQMHRKFFIFV